MWHYFYCMKQMLIFDSSSKIYNCCQYNLLKLSTSLFFPQVILVFFLVFTVIKFSPGKQAFLPGRYSQFLLVLITAFSLALAWQFQFYTYSFILIYRIFNYHNNLWLFWKQDWCGRPADIQTPLNLDWFHKLPNTLLLVDFYVFTF